MTQTLTSGQVFSHTAVGTSDMERSVRFYDAVLAPIGLVRQKSFRVASGYGPKDFDGINLPFWILRMGHRRMPVGRRERGFDLNRLNLDVDELERIGPALVFDFRNQDGVRVLVWTQ